MTRNIKLFLIVILVSLPFWWGVNLLQRNMEDFFYVRQIEKNPPSLFVAQVSQNLRSMVKVEKSFPVPKNSEIEAESAISVRLDKDGKEKVLFERKGEQKMAIASLTKLMTAIIVKEFYQDSLRTQISKTAVAQEGEDGNLKTGEILRVEDLLHIMLIESSNDAAFALAQLIGTEGFVSLMNLKAKDMGLTDTYFFNPTGLDPEDSNGKVFYSEINYSTAEDLAKLAKYLLKKPLILEDLGKKEYDLYLENGVFHHTLINTNELLGEMPGIIGGKTGFTEISGGCLLIIMEGQESGSYLINVVLNSPNRFENMQKLIAYVAD